jgi:hypothetical protein
MLDEISLIFQTSVGLSVSLDAKRIHIPGVSYGFFYDIWKLPVS